MRFAPWTVSAAAALLASFSVVAQADELTMPSSASASDHPNRGMSMDKVEATFGAPSNRVPAVGQPPITRWEYPGFVVYFENSTVLHTVIKG
jgi:hypothetical protein